MEIILDTLDEIIELIKWLKCTPNEEQDRVISIMITRLRSIVCSLYAEKDNLSDDEFVFLLEKVDALLVARRAYFKEGKYWVRYSL